MYTIRGVLVLKIFLLEKKQLKFRYTVWTSLSKHLFTVYKNRVPNTVARRVSSSVAMVTTLPAVVSMVVLVSMVAVAMVGMTVIFQPRLK